ncbi:MAG TPA: ATP-binding protein [Candidatus Agathobaculum pullicola]|nr:ATP-binding protein [Candidatus Agathobaculum pullicola]
MCFNRALKQFLNQTLSRNTNGFCVIEVYGPKGSGKSTAIEEVLRTANMQHKIITFSKDNLCPFQDMLSKQMEGTEDEQYTAALSELLQQDTVLVLADV